MTLPAWASPFFSLIAQFWLPALIILGIIGLIVGTGGDLLGLVFKGGAHLAQLGTNLLARTGGVVGLVMLGIIVIAVLHVIPGAPNLTNFFGSALSAPPPTGTGNPQVTATPGATG